MAPFEPSELVGKMVRDEWGRRHIGMVVSVLMDDKGEAGCVLIRMGNGEFRRYRLSNISMEGSEVVLLSGIKRKIDALYRKKALLRHEKLLLSNFKDSDIGSEALNEMMKEVKRSLGFLEGEARYLFNKVEHLIRRCTDQIRDINKGIACLQVEHELGKVDDERFHISMKMLLSGLKSVLSERDDLIEARRRLLELLGKEQEELHVKAGEGEEPVKDVEGGPIDVEVEEEPAVALQA